MCYVFSNSNTLLSGTILCSSQNNTKCGACADDLPMLFHNMFNKVSHICLKGLQCV